jgi:hypothetical protein
MTKDQLDLLEAVIHSLDTEPERWKWDAYGGEHGCGVRVWTANKYYGLAIKDDSFRDVVGGVTGWSTFFGNLIPWRRRLMAAVRRARPQDNNVKRALAAITAT